MKNNLYLLALAGVLMASCGGQNETIPELTDEQAVEMAIENLAIEQSLDKVQSLEAKIEMAMKESERLVNTEKKDK
jgi:thiamine biosynthesis lipoprotein ApbE